MKKIFTGVLIIALSIGAAQAQNAHAQKQGDRKEYAQAYDQLNLSTEQQASVKKINEDFRKKMQELNKQDQLTVAEMKQRRQALQDQHKSQVQAVLTPAQKDQLAKMQADRKTINKEGKKEGKAKFKRGGQAMGKRGADMQKELNLTPGQQEKVTKIRSDFKNKMQALRNDNAISQDQKKEKMRELMTQQQEQIKSVLTKEQVEKMKSLRQEHKARNTK